MYEYAPRLKKTREKIWVSVCLLLGAVAYGFGNLLPYPVLYQLLAVGLLAAAILITVRYLLRDYIYCVTPSKDGEDLDLTVVEVMGKKRTVVCRVSVADIQSVTRVTDRRGQKTSDSQRKTPVYRYVSELQPQNACLLLVLDNKNSYFLEICANEELISVLEGFKKQYLSDI